ncbi:MAG: hypothetical protein EZS28_048672, partial [Streblomastix strix]
MRLIQVKIKMSYEMIQEILLMNYTLSLQVIQTLTSITKIETKQMACVLFVDPKVTVYVIEGDIESDCDTDQYGTDAYEDNDDNEDEEEVIIQIIS